MRRMVSPLTAVLVVALLGSDSPREYDDATENVSLEGSWEQVGAVWNGHVTLFRESPCVLTYRNGTEATYQHGHLLEERACTVDVDSHPGWMDFVATAGNFKGRTGKYIYRI